MLTAWQGHTLRSVELSTFFDISEARQETLAGALQEFQKGWPKRSIDLLGAEVSENELLVSHLQVTHHVRDEEGGGIRIELDCTKYEVTYRVATRRRRRLEETAQSIMKVLAKLQPYATECHFHCRLMWLFPADSVSTIVQLPMLKVSIPGTPFEQISGIRFTAPSADPHQYVILDLEDDNNLYLTTGFAYFDDLSAQIVERVVERGRELRDAFIKQPDLTEGEEES